jgi:replicative DNA helicase
MTITPLLGISDRAFEALKNLVNHEAEQALLGAILVNNRAYDACTGLAPDDFAHPLHGRIFATIRSLIAAGSVATPVTLRHYFSGEDAAFGGNPGGYLHRLAASAVTIINSPHYAKTIIELSRRRRLVCAAEQIGNDAETPEPERDADTVLDDAEQLLCEIGETTQINKGPQPLSTIAPAALGAVEAAYQRAGSGGSGAIVVDTGLSRLDNIVRGMGAGDLVVLAGRPAMGKTALAITIAANAAALGKVILFFSLEMTAEQLVMRWVAGRTGIPTDKQRHGEIDGVDFQNIFEANAVIACLPIHIDDQPRLSAGQVRQRARRIRRQHSLNLIIIDHLQLMRQQDRQESRRTEIGDITSSLKALAKELELPILLLSQLNRALEARDDKRPTMADLKESGDIEQDADVVVFVHRDAPYLERAEPRIRARQTEEEFDKERCEWLNRCEDARGIANLIVAKNRQGNTGTARVAFDALRQQFLNLWNKETCNV